MINAYNKLLFIKVFFMENFNKVTKYYDIDVNLESELKDAIVDEMVNYYLKNFKCDYDSQYYKLYIIDI